MGWFFGSNEEEEYRLMAKRTPAGGIVFWVRSVSKATNPDGTPNQAYVQGVLMALKRNLPLDWLTAQATARPGVDTFSCNVFRGPDGSGEVHLDISNIRRTAPGDFQVGS